MGKGAPVGRRPRTVRRSGNWREFTERKWGWQARRARTRPCAASGHRAARSCAPGGGGGAGRG
ncbi:hypothetical protein F7R21_33640, partial [Burkholderia latens]